MFLSDTIRYLAGAVEITILFFAIYGVLYYLHSSRGILILLALIGLWCCSLVAGQLHLDVISYILGIIGNSSLILLFVLFHPELRRALAQLGSYADIRHWRRRREMIGEIVAAAGAMAGRKCGALIVIERKMRLQTLADDAVKLDNPVDSLLLQSIFFPNAPLHDGAVIIRDDRIIAARAILPLTRSTDVPPQLGTRHRAALGISEECDAVAVVVSEETGSISIAQRGALTRDVSCDDLRRLLEKLLVYKDDEEFSETAKLLADPAVEAAGDDDGGRES